MMSQQWREVEIKSKKRKTIWKTRQKRSWYKMKRRIDDEEGELREKKRPRKKMKKKEDTKEDREEKKRKKKRFREKLGS